MRRALLAMLIVLVAAGGAALRLPELAERPMHTDEAVHAYKLGETLEGGRGAYHYDPVEFHGPTLNFLTVPIALVRGQETHADLDEWTLRLVPAVFGIALILATFLLADGLGGPGAFVAAALTATSTAMVYYSRYYIMEVLLVFFTFLLVVGAWRYVRTHGVGWAVLAGVGVGLMHATKETWVFVPVAAAAALVVEALFVRFAPAEPLHVRRHVRRREMLWALVAAIVVAVAFFSSFFAYARGPWDSVATYVHMFRRALGTADKTAGDLHVNPWHFYLRILFWFQALPRRPIFTEAIIPVLALIGMAAGFLRRGLGRADARLVRVLGVASFALLGIYTLIPYKTPWCMLGAMHGMILVGGVGGAALVRWTPTRPLKVLVALLLAAGVAQLGWQAWRGSYRLAASSYNPYVYGHTRPGAIRLGERAEQVANVHPAGKSMPINVLTPDEHDIWPLPWYLRQFDRRAVGYFPGVEELLAVRGRADAPMLVFTSDVWPSLEPRLKAEYQWEHFGLRPSVVLVVGIRKDLWEQVLEGIRARHAAEKAKGTAAMTSPSADLHRFAHRAMMSQFEILVPAEACGVDDARAAAGAAFEELDRNERRLSRFDAYGDVGRVNATPPGEAVVVDIETAECVAAALDLARRTEGAFDPTAGKPADGRRRIGAELIAVDAESMTVTRLDAGVALDLGGIGKGFAVDAMAGAIGEWGIESALVNGGSSTALAVGSAPGGGAWRLALRDPADDSAELGSVRLQNAAFSGSATLVEQHIVDPRTRRPVPAGRAAWAVAPTAAEADALTTAFCVMETEAVRRYVERHPQVACVVARRVGDRWEAEACGRAVFELSESLTNTMGERP